MRISTRSRYGLRAVIDLAEAGADVPVSLRDIADRQGLSIKYLETLLTRLVKARILKSRRGVSGGYTLARPPSDINAFDVLHALGDDLTLLKCVGPDALRCKRANRCRTRPLWTSLNETITRELKQATLDRLMKGV